MTLAGILLMPGDHVRQVGRFERLDLFVRELQRERRDGVFEMLRLRCADDR